MDILLKPGVHQYKFICDGTWCCNAACPTRPDDSGNENNVVEVEESTDCHHASRGCGWEGPTSTLAAHLAICPFEAAKEELEKEERTLKYVVHAAARPPGRGDDPPPLPAPARLGRAESLTTK